MYQPWTLERLAQHQIIILGMGREGWSTYQFLRTSLPSASFLLIDDRPISKLDPKWSEHTASDPLISFSATKTAGELPSKGLIIKTPGLPPHHPLLKNTQLPITSNTQLFFDLLQTGEAGIEPENITTIGVTGTKGKSTTSSLIAHVLKKAKLNVVLGGNIGVPPLDLVSQLKQKAKMQFVVLELSAHQLADLQTSPQIAVVQNIVPEHLDYYATFDDYLDAKKQITRWQTSDDLVIYNPDSTTARSLAALSAGTHIPFRVETFNDWLLFQDEPIIKLSEIPLVGEHNLQNILPAIVIAQHFEIPTLEIAKAIKSFAPLAHRLELVGEKNQVRYYNDSLSTVPDATIAALKAFASQAVVLLAGGHERHQDFGELAAYVCTANVKAVLLFATTGERLQKDIENYHQRHADSHLPTLVPVKNMAEAVAQAAKIAQPNEVVLMSPASPSFGEFKDYQDRGNQFRELVEKL